MKRLPKTKISKARPAELSEDIVLDAIPVDARDGLIDINEPDGSFGRYTWYVRFAPFSEDEAKVAADGITKSTGRRTTVASSGREVFVLVMDHPSRVSETTTHKYGIKNMKHIDESIDLYKDTKVATNGTEAYVSVICPKCHKNGMFVDRMRLAEWKNGCRKWENGYSIREAFPNLTRDQQDMLENGKICFDCEYGEGIKESTNVRRELEPTNGRASFGRKAYVEDDGDGFTLISYDTPVARIERCEDGNGQDFSLLANDYLSATTLTHIHSFLHTYGHKDIPTKELKNLDIGEIVHLDNPNRKLVKEGAGAGYTVHIKGLKTGKILNMQKKGKDPSDEYYEVEVEVAPCEVEVGAEDYYTDFFWQEHEFGDTPTAQIDGGVVTAIVTWWKDEDEIRRELENTELDFDFDYGWGWSHVDLPRNKPIEADHIKTKNDSYCEIFEIKLNAPDLADAVNCGYKSIDDMENEEEPEEDADGEYDDPSLQTMANELSESVINESYDDEWAEVGAAFDEFRQRLWKYTRKDRENRMEFFQDCMRKCEDALKTYHDVCVAED